VEGDDVVAAQVDLVAWGLLEPGAHRLTRRAQASLARAAQVLREEELAGRARPGNPLVLAAGLAVAELAPEALASTLHHQVLAAVELASLPEGVRGMFSGPSP
jgi:hypothetical protein